MRIKYGVPFVSKLSNVSIFTEQSMFSQGIDVWKASCRKSLADQSIFSYGSGI